MYYQFSRILLFYLFWWFLYSLLVQIGSNQALNGLFRCWRCCWYFFCRCFWRLSPAKTRGIWVPTWMCIPLGKWLWNVMNPLTQLGDIGYPMHIGCNCIVTWYPLQTPRMHPDSKIWQAAIRTVQIDPCYHVRSLFPPSFILSTPQHL